ncbi:HDOD domain-containing protein [uncultured Desulfosarcina sp.]|uniref:EAL and HDOD domain-containing protein n=1 Tax=uncultured Desulfosarcina sp. TaxID=218289 RepID=UPI0029C7C728|nr:HDOD domain-containing protein [uncultured Desulfosarcina sp.]
MTDDQQPTAHAASVSIARQPIFDENRRLWGYELFCVGEGASPRTDGEPENMAITVAASAYMGLQQILRQGQKIMLNFDEMSILDDMPYALPPVNAAVQVDERVFLRPDIPQMLERLKSDGYLIAVRGFSGEPQFDRLYELADIIAVPVIGRQKAEVATLLSTIHDVDARLLARRVDDAAGFAMCREAGVTLFEGAFFKQPDTITVHKMTSNAVSRLKLLQNIEQRDPDIDALAETIQSDVAISFRLLTYLNSTAFGLSQKIKSIQHAIRLLGWPKLKNWLRVILLNDMSETAAPDLIQLSAQRGKFLELVAQHHDFWGFDPESLHLLGLFSLLDTMLGTPMEEIVTFLPLENKLKDALRREANNEYLPLVQLAQCVEEARWEDADVMMQKLNLNRDKVTAAFKDAVEWADQLTAVHAGNPG